MNKKKYTISIGRSVVGPGVWKFVEARVWTAVSAREGSIVSVAECISFTASSGGKGDGGERGDGGRRGGGGRGVGCASFLAWGGGGGAGGGSGARAGCAKELSMRVEILS